MKQDNYTDLLLLWQQNDKQAEQALYSLAYQHLHQLAKQERVRCAQKYGDDNQVLGSAMANTTALVHDAYLKLSQSRPSELANRRQFFLMVAKVMRQILIDHARKEGAQKRQPGSLEQQDEATEKLISLNQVLDGLSAHYPRQADVVKLKYFAGLKTKEISRILECSESLVEKDLRFSRGWMQLQIS